jgi:hypothetical protein
VWLRLKCGQGGELNEVLTQAAEVQIGDWRARAFF